VGFSGIFLLVFIDDGFFISISKKRSLIDSIEEISLTWVYYDLWLNPFERDNKRPSVVFFSAFK